MSDYIERKFEFSGSVSLNDLYAMLTGVANSTGSNWEATATLGRLYRFVNRRLDVTGSNVRGRINRSDLELEFACEADYLEDSTAQDYFGGIKFVRPFAWKGDLDTNSDKNRLRAYLDEVTSALYLHLHGTPKIVEIDE
ncbi:MAG TPA: hypothetical protein VJH04_00410 [archaeon]|nr:hypothetical protein [archaeon]